MNNLASLRSQLLLDGTQKGQHKQWQSQNFYKHHNLPLRSSLRTSENKGKIRTIQEQTNKNSRVSLSPLKTNIDKFQIRQQEKTIGRNIFNDVEKAKIPGPGSYEPFLSTSMSHCYIKKQQDHILSKIAKRMRKRALINQCRGPGLYNPQAAFNSTSKSRSASQGKILSANEGRALISNHNIDKFYLTSTFKQSNLIGKSIPSPDFYDLSNSRFKTSNFSTAISHRMSNIKRSNIARQDLLPGPGSYQWQKFFDNKKIIDKDKKSQRPKIEFKFIYGHPS